MELLGGQAIIEGVMMKGKTHLGYAVRKKGKIVTKKEPFSPLKEKYKILGIPFLRGIVNMGEMMVIGIKALNWSADQALEEEDGEKDEFTGWHLALSLVFAFALAIGIFKLIPLGITRYLFNREMLGESRILFNVVDGLIRISLFTAYLYLISLWKDVRVLFEYHGAEHKAVACHEAGKELTVENVQGFSRLHPRCGTSFIIFVFLIAIIVFSLAPIDINFVSLFFIRLVLILPIAGIGYEVLRYSALMKSKMFFSVIIQPGMWFQRITTSEPKDKQVEVSIAALKEVL
tara:strand:+ start:1263 stop:2129 length:867 start_codon:yes stop_codon:yes gene_type:complete